MENKVSAQEPRKSYYGEIGLEQLHLGLTFSWQKVKTTSKEENPTEIKVGKRGGMSQDPLVQCWRGRAWICHWP